MTRDRSQQIEDIIHETLLLQFDDASSFIERPFAVGQFDLQTSYAVCFHFCHSITYVVNRKKWQKFRVLVEDHSQVLS